MVVPELAKCISTIRSHRSNPNPVITVWKCLRLGHTLCHLVNHFQPNAIAKIGVDAKQNIFYFLKACKELFDIDQQHLFTIRDLLESDTTGFVRVVKTVDLVLVALNASSTTSYSSTTTTAPLTSQQKAVMELLVTERKHNNDMETLQVRVSQINSHPSRNTCTKFDAKTFSISTQLLEYSATWIKSLIFTANF